VQIFPVVRLLIRGRVQGVSFRSSMQVEARRLAVTGWVRNRRDGSVEAVAQGPAEAVEALVEWSRHGPPGARVTDVQLGAGEGEFADFELRPTE
jgi:acylphosphatase